MEHKMELEEKVVSKRKADFARKNKPANVKRLKGARKRRLNRGRSLDEIAERQRKREQELEERERLKKEAILRGTPLDDRFELQS
ncbi:unnamed protein product [Lactuca virosa]|uniref:IBB domain-containing protein n=1 Tax=Lactuca virosa TaxID=75947 RepID=A0AAU9M479_9ASTR|nr:unnamed protein product [Lactuca virosa]